MKDNQHTNQRKPTGNAHDVLTTQEGHAAVFPFETQKEQNGIHFTGTGGSQAVPFQRMIRGGSVGSSQTLSGRNQGTVQRFIDLEYDDATGEELAVNHSYSAGAMYNLLTTEWGIPPSLVLKAEITRLSNMNAIFSDTAELIEVLKAGHFIDWGGIGARVEADWPALLDHYVNGNVSARRRDGIDGAHYEDVFASFAAEYTVTDTEEIYPGVNRISYQMKKEGSEDLYPKVCRKTVTMRGAYPPERLKNMLLAAATAHFAGGIADGHWNAAAGATGFSVSGFVNGGHFIKFNLGVN